jgi:anti-sigma factor RsiW
MADHVTDRLAAWLGDETSPGETAAITRHLEACAACRREAAALRAAWDALGEAAVPAAEASVWPAVRARTTARSAPRLGQIRHPVWRGALAAAAVAAGILLGSLVPVGGVAVAEHDEDFAWLSAGSWSQENTDATVALWLDLATDEEATP